MKKLLLTFACGFLYSAVNAQTGKSISGFIVDAATGNVIEFAPLALKHQHIGTVSNEGGKFDLQLPEEAANDTLQFLAFGYKPLLVPVAAISGPLSIRLQSNIKQLQEVDVRPLPPDHYVRMALQRYKQNYPGQPFQSLAYYREKLTENGEFLQFDEGVFKTYCPKYTDTIRNQDQLLLYRRAESLAELQFMKKEREKDEKRVADGKKKKSHVDIDFADSFSGPQNLLSSAKIKGENANYLDTTKLDDYKFTWEPSTFYYDVEVMVIAFKSKGKVEHIRETGKLYIDRNSLAIVKIENSGDFVIPVLLRPIIRMYGFSVENPTFTKDISFQRIGNLWYPQQIHEDIDFEVTKHHLFSKNDVSKFRIEQDYVVNRLKTSQIAPIAAEWRYTGGKEMEKQLHNDENLDWNSVNGIKRQ